jgi:zinc transport system substrate-binding protein
MRYVFVVLAAIASVACGDDDTDARSGRISSVVVAIAPLAEPAAQMGGRFVEVTNLTPPGVEPHDLELSADDAIAIEDADLAIVMGGGFQPAIEEAAARRDGPTLVVLDEIGGPSKDPHVWLDPVLMRDVVEAIARSMDVAVGLYAEEVTRLHQEYEAGLARCERRVIVTAHDAFGRLAARYDLEQVAIAGVSPDAEPDPRHLAELADLVREKGITTIFTEELVSPVVAQALARETGVRTDVLDPIETLEGDNTYLLQMSRNLEALRAALGCQ